MGGINFLVNNAGTNPHLDPKLTAEESHWDKILMSISKVISAWLKLVWAVYEDEGVGKSSIWHPLVGYKRFLEWGCVASVKRVF